MAATAQYAATPKIDNAIATVAESSFSAPTNAVCPFVSGNSGARVDDLNITATGTSVASQLRIYVANGYAGKTIFGISSTTTTATITTETAHGLKIGDLITVQNAFPSVYNAKNVAVTSIPSATTFTYAISSFTGSAVSVGEYTSTDATPTYTFLKDIPISAVTPSNSVSAFNTTLCSKYNPEILPIILPAGYSIRTAISVAQTSGGINTTAKGGKF